MLDKQVANVIKDNMNMMVPFYLMASYAYYVDDDPILTDGFYDNLAKIIYKEWDNITHRHRDVIDKDALKAGSFLGKYPSIIEGALKSFRDNTK
jgi:hypothetical protein